MNEKQGNRPTPADEVDLGQVFRLIGNVFDRIFNAFLRLFLFVKRNFLWLAGLLVLGVILGFLVKNLITHRQKIDVIITPNFENVAYLEDVVEQLESNLKNKDTAFFNSIGMEVSGIEGFDIELVSLRSEKALGTSEETEFLEVLAEFNNADAIGEILRTELEERTTRDHRITFYFSDVQAGVRNSRKLIEYINSNGFYRELNAVYLENTTERIDQNDSLIAQIDRLVRNYSDKIAREKNRPEGQLLVENQEVLDVASLLQLKNNLVEDTEERRLELVSRKEPFTIVSFGEPYVVERKLFVKWILLIPELLIGAFLLVSLLLYLDRKATQRNLQ